jgi:hypothetical protein
MNGQAVRPKKGRWGRILLYVTGILVILLVAGYFIANAIVRNKVDEALRGLPPAWQVGYKTLRVNLLAGSLAIDGIEGHYTPDGSHADTFSIHRVGIAGLHLMELWKTHRLLIDRLRLTGLKVTGKEALKESFAMEGQIELDSVYRDTTGAQGAGGIRVLAEKARYLAAGMNETIHLRGFELDSKKRLLHLDTLRINPNLDKEEMGRVKGHQVDVVESSSEGINVKNLDVMALLQHELSADEISIESTKMHVFRDRRLPLEPGEKAMPVEGLKSMPLSLRVGRLKIGTTTFAYEEFPKKGNQTGTMTIYRMRGTLAPLINKPVNGDPAYITMTTEGSLMNSGSVTATTRMPLHKGDPYVVDGAFHELDVTKLNNPAENLGKLHLESGMLNSLDFRFEMNDDKATGQIIGEYHDLVVDKLKENSNDKKVDKLKSFALKKFIIPKDKDKSLPVSKRTGKVDYKRDKERYFSYYLLHSLLVGVKSSFSLGFLLPG